MKIFVVLALIAYVSAAHLPSAERQVVREWQIQPRFETDEDKIVDGKPATLRTFRFIVSLRYRSNRFHFCGGTIIGKARVLTAAHCTDGQYASQLEVVGGQIYKDSYDSTEQEIDVSSIAQHGSYNSRTTNYDFAVLRLSKSFNFNNYVDKATLGSKTNIDAGTTVYVAGWGALSEGGSSPNRLQYLSLPIISNSECAKNYGSSAITNQMICAGYMKGGKDSCQGDSGGPLTTGIHDYATVIGVVSWGYGCARPNYPGVYAKVAAVKNWINSI